MELIPRLTPRYSFRSNTASSSKQALQLRMEGEEQFSPYNPPLRLLASELAAAGRSMVLQPGGGDNETSATLVDISQDSTSISTFTFKLSRPADVPVAGYAIFDFSTVIERQYQHMNQSSPRRVNDDLVRTWTVTWMSADRTQLSVTVKRQKGGLISSLLHAMQDEFRGAKLEIRLLGFGHGGLSCYPDDGSLPPQLWLAAGVGITPFLALYRHLASHPERAFNATLLFSCRGDEVKLATELAADPRVKVIAFDSTATPGTAAGTGVAIEPRRLSAADVEQAAAGVHHAWALLCGPTSYQTSAREWLQQAGLPAVRIRAESFDF